MSDDRFDRLLGAMVQGEAPSAQKKQKGGAGPLESGSKAGPGTDAKR